MCCLRLYSLKLLRLNLELSHLIHASPLHGSYFHLSRLQRVVITGPRGPLDAVSERSVWTSVVVAVQIRLMTTPIVTIPPGSMVDDGTVVAIRRYRIVLVVC